MTLKEAVESVEAVFAREPWTRSALADIKPLVEPLEALLKEAGSMSGPFSDEQIKALAVSEHAIVHERRLTREERCFWRVNEARNGSRGYDPRTFEDSIYTAQCSCGAGVHVVNAPVGYQGKFMVYTMFDKQKLREQPRAGPCPLTSRKLHEELLAMAEVEDDSTIPWDEQVRNYETFGPKLRARHAEATAAVRRGP